MSEALDVTNLPAGTVLMNKYRVKRSLGVGGMGVVVAADHLQLGTTVAIKLLLPSLLHNEQVVKRFVLEAKASTRIRSAHVAHVLDVGGLTGPGLPSEGIPYMVMEYLHGRDLAEWVRMGKKFPVGEAIDYAVQAGEALAQAHKVGIIHRDIKPANLFLAEHEDGKIVKVLDFGISKILDEEPQEMGLTKTTTVLGSGLYMSPEQMRSAKNVDFRTDIYSLGVCLYELLTGTQPHTAETFSELCVKVNIDPPTPLRDYRPDISEELAQAIARAYARKPDERYQTVQDFVFALAPFAEGTALPTINQIQSITRHESIMPRSGISGVTPLPLPPPLPRGSEPSLHRTGAAVTAEAKPVHPRQRSNVAVALTVVVGLILVALGAGVAVWQKAPAAAPGPSTTQAEPEPLPSPAKSPEPAVSEPPPAPSPAESTVSAPPSASASSHPSPTPHHQPPPPTPQPPKPPPMKNCTRLNPDTGLMEVYPCPG